MAYPDLSDLQSRVRDRLNEATASFFSTTQITAWINDGENDIALKGLCLESIQSKSTTSTVRTVAVTCIKVHHVEYIPTGTNVGLIKINPLQIGRAIDDTVTTPQCWFQWGQAIGIDPVPDDTYALKIYTSIHSITGLSEATDEPAIPPEFIPLIIDFAVYRGLLRDNQYAKAAEIYVPYINKLKQVRNRVLERYSNIRKDMSIPNTIVYKV